MLSFDIRRLLPAAFAALVFLVFTPACHSAGYQAGIIYGPPGPTGPLRVTRPAISWKVWPRGDSAVTSASMEINGASVPSTYSTTQRAVLYTPDQSLQPGLYNVKCTITIDNIWPIEKSWSFTVPADARETVAPPNAAAQAALATANAYRRTMGLPMLHLDDRLCAAAEAHSRYQTVNRAICHIESPQDAGFVGREPSDRAAAYGYGSGCSEDVSYGAHSPGRAVQGLLDVPYHRFPFMQPGSPDFGAGFSGSHTTLEFGESPESGVAVYPVDRESQIPLSWRDRESPDPLRMHATSGPVGYPITVSYYVPGDKRITAATATLSTADRPVPFFLNTPSNDDQLTNGIIIIPRSPLSPGATYTASVDFTSEGGKHIQKSWSFTTRDSR